MFAQVIQAKTSNPDGFSQMQEKWEKELRPGAKGWVGTTGGVAEDGTVILCVRFESEEAAKANSDRPEQGAFFEEMKKHIDGEPTFVNSSDTAVLEHPSDKAGFVQVMTYEVNDRQKLEQLEAEFMPGLVKNRPDLLGQFRVWDGNTAIDFLYFTSEAEAREGEKTMGADPEMQKQLEQFMALGGEPTFIDLPNPILRSA